MFVAGAVLVNIGVPEDLTPMLESAAAATHALADAALDSLTRQGLQRLDALAALLLEGGLQEHAMLRAFVYAGQHGKCVEIWRDRCLEKGMLSQVGCRCRTATLSEFTRSNDYMACLDVALTPADLHTPVQDTFTRDQSTLMVFRVVFGVVVHVCGGWKH